MNKKRKGLFRSYRQLFHSLRYRHLILFTILFFVASSTINTFLVRAAGPGLGNLTYSSAELNTRISIINDSNPPGATGSGNGHGNVTMHDGYLVTIYTHDSGGSNAGFAFWNVSNPRSPV